MGVKNYKVVLCRREEIEKFIETWHYSKNVNGLISQYNFKLLNENNELIGAIMLGDIAMAGVWKKYVNNPNDLIELRRLCCVDDTPKNTESYFIGRVLKWLSKHTVIKKVISYADATYNHTGVIYQASNFQLVGKTASGKVILYNGKRYHDKAIRTKYRGKLKPFAITLLEALESGEAKFVKTKGKYIYIYKLKRKRQPNFNDRYGQKSHEQLSLLDFCS